MVVRGELDAMFEVPPSLSERIKGGEQAVLDVTYNSINPVFGAAVPEQSYVIVSDLNRRIVEAGIANRVSGVRAAREGVAELDRQLEEVNRAAETVSSEDARALTEDLDRSLGDLESALERLEDGPGEVGKEMAVALERVREAREQLEKVREAQSGGAEGIKRRIGVAELETSLEELQRGLSDFSNAPPEVLANPLRLEIRNLASQPNVVGFYTPAVLALLIQHIAVSLASLAVIRERLSGAYEFFEVSPLRPGELLAGQFMTYFGLVLGVHLAVAAVLTGFLDTPVVGGFLAVALAMVLLTAASLGLGFLVSALASSQLQAVQVAMLLLIASAFFTGFLFPLEDMNQPGRAISYFLPTTYGIHALQDVMIQGERISTFDVAALIVIAAVCLGLARYFMGRRKL